MALMAVVWMAMVLVAWMAMGRKRVLECGTWFLKPMEGTLQTYIMATGNGNNTSTGKADERGGNPMAARAALAAAGVVMVKVKGDDRD